MRIASFGAQDARVKVVSFSRNFGHQMAITAGLDYSSGNAVVVMDGDLQDPPEVIPRLVAEWQAGNDIVFAVRASRKGESLFKRITASLFYRILRRLTTTDIPLPVEYGSEIRELVSDFGVARRRMSPYPIGMGTARPARMGTRPAFGSAAANSGLPESGMLATTLPEAASKTVAECPRPLNV